MFERRLAVIVAIMGLSFLINFFIMMPPPTDILRGLLPRLPNTVSDPSSGPFLVVASMVGTTVFSGLFIIRTTLVKEAGWGLEDAKAQRNDAVFAVVLMFVISAAVMAAAAGTLLTNSIGLSTVSHTISFPQPLAVQLATSLFAVCFIFVGVFSHFPIVSQLSFFILPSICSVSFWSLP